ncbi:phospholipid scramblase 1-like [Littorina saxatilis]|uniref:phospholipid scramblase 1-like n=1 Tax=Littorina saxatilis TaxID=31220 RepID=UPI0038B5EC6A
MSHPAGPPPVVAQPGPVMQQQMVAMPPPPPVPGCPPGLEYLAQLDQVMVEQEVHMLEVLTGFEVKNKFRIMNSQNQQVYYAAEESGTLMRICCGPSRGFVYHITDNFNQEVLRVRRDFRCCTGCTCCGCESCRYYAVIEDRNGETLGYVSNLVFCCKPLFGIFDTKQELVAQIRGPCCPIQAVCCTADVDFPVVELANGGHIGTLSKVWPGFLKESFTKADNFRVTFPISLDVKQKALMIAAVFIVDMMVYEVQKKNH